MQRAPNAARRRQRGAIALEYILIAALVGISLIAAFRLWGRVTAKAVEGVAVNPHSGGALLPAE